MAISITKLLPIFGLGLLAPAMGIVVTEVPGYACENPGVAWAGLRHLDWCWGPENNPVGSGLANVTIIAHNCYNDLPSTATELCVGLCIACFDYCNAECVDTGLRLRTEFIDPVQPGLASCNCTAAADPTSAPLSASVSITATTASSIATAAAATIFYAL